MLKVGFVGWRGMVGSVLMERMIAEKDFKGFEPIFYSTSQVGGQGPDVGMGVSKLQDAYDIKQLSKMDIILTCQGSDHTNEVFKKVLDTGWKGYWIDASSALRMKDWGIISLDPVNLNVIKEGLAKGIKVYSGGNCTVSLMLMAIHSLFQKGYVEWLSTMTYQSASGAGAKTLRELVEQMNVISKGADSLLSNPATNVLDIDRKVTDILHQPDFPTSNFGAPLAVSVIPWIDKKMDNGQTKEEWKGFAETNKILGNKTPVPVDGLCVRVGSMRCHSQALTLKLKKDIPLDEIIAMIKDSNKWVKVIPNDKPETIKELSPAAVSGTLTVPIGRIRKMKMGPEYLTAFTVGDQLLWGAAEPLRRMLNILLEHLG